MSAYNTATLNNLGIFWCITACSPLRVMSLPSSGSKDKPSKRPEWKQVPSRAVVSMDGGDIFPRNVRWLFNRLHGVMSQKVEHFITSAVRTSNLLAPEAVDTFVMMESLVFIINSCMLELWRINIRGDFNFSRRILWRLLPSDVTPYSDYSDCSLLLQGRIVKKMAAIYFSETLLHFWQTTRRHIPEQ
jgi:hypothetical protein